MHSSVGLVGASARIRAIDEAIEQAARSHAKVLITGESGVGKEIVARLIHERSSRARVPLVTINCAGFPDTLLESELFGHVRGSFTDAHRDKRGWLETAHGGTVFMDEIGEMSLRMQALLLRFLETGEIQRVGADRPLPPVDVRVIAATHRQLIDRIAEQSFRLDLYYRLNVIQIAVPPLRERREDVGVLLRHFLDLFARAHRRDTPDVTPDALKQLTDYHWPGNVRELRNVSERLVLASNGARVDVHDLPEEVRLAASGTPARLGAGAQRARHDVLFERLAAGGSFWSEVYEPFMSRDLTRDEVRAVVRLGLEHTRGNYKQLVTSFNMRNEDYKRFLNFLRKYQCHVPFQRFRMLPGTLGGPSAHAEVMPPQPRAARQASRDHLSARGN